MADGSKLKAEGKRKANGEGRKAKVKRKRAKHLKNTNALPIQERERTGGWDE